METILDKVSTLKRMMFEIENTYSQADILDKISAIHTSFVNDYVEALGLQIFRLISEKNISSKYDHNMFYDFEVENKYLGKDMYLKLICQLHAKNISSDIGVVFDLELVKITPYYDKTLFTFSLLKKT